MRALMLGLVVLFGPGCVPVQNTSDFIEVHGQFVDGHLINQKLAAQTGIVPSVIPALGTVTAVGAETTGPDDLQGFRIEWLPAQVQSGMTYTSSAAGPVVFVFVGPDATNDGGVGDETPDIATSGTVTFTQVSAASGSTVKGTFANILLNAGDAPFITIDNGSFQAKQP